MTMDRHNRVVWTGHCYWLVTLRHTTAQPFCPRIAVAHLVPSRVGMHQTMVLLLCQSRVRFGRWTLVLGLHTRRHPSLAYPATVELRPQYQPRQCRPKFFTCSMHHRSDMLGKIWAAAWFFFRVMRSSSMAVP